MTSTLDIPPSLQTDNCGNKLYMDFTCPTGMSCCTARFEANPDASGIGIVIAFASNGAINMIIATFLWYLKNFRRPFNPQFECWVQNLADFLAQASLFPGITLLVAAFSQFKTITNYHLWVSVVLADLTTSGRVVVLLNVFLSDQRITKIQASLAFLFQSLFLASLGVLIWRLNNWSDNPGQCFAFHNNGYNTMQDRSFVRFWVIFQLCIWIYWHIIAVPLVNKRMVEKIPKAVRFWFSFIFYVVLDLFLWIWQLYLIARGMVANRDRIIGDEWQMGFGQVASLVAFATVIYAIVLSYQGYILRQKEGDGKSSREKDEEMAFVAA
ncbi:hypothetical protein CPB86DRAFT_790266 [Serendipita vermifera]|nr:hypothetical protein CPB86DRAFT_790266 [Serendipita vermifera]